MRTMVATLGAAGLSLSMIVGTARAVDDPARMPMVTINPLQHELKVDTLSLKAAQGVAGSCSLCAVSVSHHGEASRLHVGFFDD